MDDFMKEFSKEVKKLNDNTTNIKSYKNQLSKKVKELSVNPSHTADHLKLYGKCSENLLKLVLNNGGSIEGRNDVDNNCGEPETINEFESTMDGKCSEIENSFDQLNLLNEMIEKVSK